MKKQKESVYNTTAEMIIADLGLQSGEFTLIGNGSHVFKNDPFFEDKATETTWVSYMVVKAATFTYLLTERELREIYGNKHRMLSLPGGRGTAQGGIIFVLEGPEVSTKGMTAEQKFDFLKSLICFRSVNNAITSLNILSYLDGSSIFKSRFGSMFAYDWIKENLRRHSNLGPSLFCLPSIIVEGIAMINEERGNMDWKEGDRSFYRAMKDMFLRKEKDDPEVKDYLVMLENPNYIDPYSEGIPKGTALEEPVLFQEPVEPNEKVVTEYDPSL